MQTFASRDLNTACHSLQIIPRVSSKHNGKYSCLASNMAGDTELTFNVEIQG
jgi:hypothetical protein